MKNCATGNCKADGCTSCFPEKRDGAPPRVHRFDLGQLEKPVRHDNGWVEVDARLTRTGVFLYRNADGSTRRELRLPEEVFDAKTMGSFRSVPVTDEHPPEFLTSKNTSKYARGSVAGDVSRDDNFVRGRLMVTDGVLLQKMDDGEQLEVSCGYTCELQEQTGVFNGEKYDSIQRNIRGNHVAIVPLGRAGRDARVRMDSALFQVVGSENVGNNLLTKPPERTVKIKIDGIEYEADSEAAIQAQAKVDKARADALAASEAKAAELQKKLDAASAKADAAEEKAAKLDADIKALPGKVSADLRARIALEGQARRVLGGKAKFDGLSDLEVRKAMLKSLSPDVKLDGKSEAYIEARLDAAMEAAEEEEEEETEDGKNPFAKKGDSSSFVTDNDDGEDDSDATPRVMTWDEANKDHADRDEAYDAMCARNRMAWTRPITGDLK